MNVGHVPRVLLVGPMPGARGGIGQFATRLAHVLAARAHINVIAFDRLYPRFTRAGRLSERPSTIDPAGDRLVPWLPWTWRSAAATIDEIRPDLLVAQWWHPLFGPCLCSLARHARAGGARVAFVCHNDRPHERFMLSDALTVRALREADVLMTMARPVAASLAELVPGARIEVMAHPPNLTFYRSPCARDRWLERLGPLSGPVILFFGNVRAYKGLEDLMRAMPAVRARVGATLVVAGTFYEPLERYRRLSERLGITGAVRFFPHYVPDGETAELFSLAHVVALPYRQASQSGIIPLAAQARVPVVATSVGGLPEALDGHGIVVPPGDPGALAVGLVRALVTPPSPPRVRGDWDTWATTLLDTIVPSHVER